MSAGIGHDEPGRRDSGDEAGEPGLRAELAELTALARVSPHRLGPIPILNPFQRARDRELSA